MTDIIEFAREVGKLRRSRFLPEPVGEGEHCRLVTPQDACLAGAAADQSLRVFAELPPAALLRATFPYEDKETGQKGSTDIHGAITILRATLNRLELALQNHEASRSEIAGSDA